MFHFLFGAPKKSEKKREMRSYFKIWLVADPNLGYVMYGSEQEAKNTGFDYVLWYMKFPNKSFFLQQGNPIVDYLVTHFMSLTTSPPLDSRGHHN
jgi:hypothetical protein